MAKAKRPRPSFDPAPPADGDTPWVPRSSPAIGDGAEPAPKLPPETIRARKLSRPVAGPSKDSPADVVRTVVVTRSAKVGVAWPVPPSAAIAESLPAAPTRRPNKIVATVAEAIATPFRLGVILALVPFSLLRRRSGRGHL